MRGGHLLEQSAARGGSENDSAATRFASKRQKIARFLSDDGGKPDTNDMQQGSSNLLEEIR